MLKKKIFEKSYLMLLYISNQLYYIVFVPILCTASLIVVNSLIYEYYKTNIIFELFFKIIIFEHIENIKHALHIY